MPWDCFWDHFGREPEPYYLHGLQSSASNFWLSIYAFAKPADIEFSWQNILQLAEWQVGDRWWNTTQRILKTCQKTIKLIEQLCFHAFHDSRLFSCHFIVGGDSLEGQLLNSRVPKWDLSTQVFTCVLSLQRKLLIDVFCIYLLVLLERLDSGDSEWHLGWWTTYSGKSLKMYSI